MRPLELRLRDRVDALLDERDQLRNELARARRTDLGKALADLMAARSRIRDLQTEVRRERQLRVSAEAHRTAAVFERDKARRRRVRAAA